MSTVNSDRHHYVEGVGDEVLLLVLLTVLVLAVIAYGACCRTSQGGAALGRPRAFDSGIGGRCPICLDDAPQKVVRTNCGHGFCAPCLHGWCERTSSVSARAMACPICRSVVTMLHIEYTPGDASTVSFVALYNRRHSGQRSVFQMIQDTPYLLRRMWHEMADLDNLRRNLQCIRLLRVLLTLLLLVLYVLSPFDLIPEAIFGVVGLIDDVAAVCFGLIIAASFYRAHLLAREQT